MLTNLNLTDMETCYKLFPADLIKKGLNLRENRFGFEPGGNLQNFAGNGRPHLRSGHFSYYGRTYAEGKNQLERRFPRHLLHPQVQYLEPQINQNTPNAVLGKRGNINISIEEIPVCSDFVSVVSGGNAGPTSTTFRSTTALSF